MKLDSLIAPVIVTQIVFVAMYIFEYINWEWYVILIPVYVLFGMNILNFIFSLIEIAILGYYMNDQIKQLSKMGISMDDINSVVDSIKDKGVIDGE